MLESSKIETVEGSDEIIELAERRLIQENPEEKDLVGGFSAIIKAFRRPNKEEMPKFENN